MSTSACGASWHRSRWPAGSRHGRAEGEELAAELVEQPQHLLRGGLDLVDLLDGAGKVAGLEQPRRLFGVLVRQRVRCFERHEGRKAAQIARAVAVVPFAE